jgi:hypothetical protein
MKPITKLQFDRYHEKYIKSSIDNTSSYDRLYNQTKKLAEDLYKTYKIKFDIDDILEAIHIAYDLRANKLEAKWQSTYDLIEDEHNVKVK